MMTAPSRTRIIKRIENATELFCAVHFLEYFCQKEDFYDSAYQRRDNKAQLRSKLHGQEWKEKEIALREDEQSWAIMLELVEEFAIFIAKDTFECTYLVCGQRYPPLEFLRHLRTMSAWMRYPELATLWLRSFTMNVGTFGMV